ncbi:MAG: 16S rRNA processing protein RimM [Helicobacter sp.]|nr:16S rRNA processing protein RimM [Helicobacter sp.]
MMASSKPKDWVCVAKIGRAVGIRGEMLLHLLSDFPESLKRGCEFFCDLGTLELEYYNPKRSLVKFSQINSKEEAKTFTNLILYTTQEATKKQCLLKENEFFWFEIIGSSIIENDELLGEVVEIERFGREDYLQIKTAPALVAQKLPKSFMIPYNKRYILEVQEANQTEIPNALHSHSNLISATSQTTTAQNSPPKLILVQFCKAILENS